jgi:hypothetical protein
MVSYQQRITVMLNLVAQLRELQRLRERLKKAELSTTANSQKKDAPLAERGRPTRSEAALFLLSPQPPCARAKSLAVAPPCRSATALGRVRVACGGLGDGEFFSGPKGYPQANYRFCLRGQGNWRWLARAASFWFLAAHKRGTEAPRPGWALS